MQRLTRSSGRVSQSVSTEPATRRVQHACMHAAWGAHLQKACTPRAWSGAFAPPLQSRVWGAFRVCVSESASGLWPARVLQHGGMAPAKQHPPVQCSAAARRQTPLRLHVRMCMAATAEGLTPPIISSSTSSSSRRRRQRELAIHPAHLASHCILLALHGLLEQRHAALRCQVRPARPAQQRTHQRLTADGGRCIASCTHARRASSTHSQAGRQAGPAAPLWVNQ